MRERLKTLEDRIGFAELAAIGVLVLAFLFGGVIWGTPVVILGTCGGFGGECRNDEYIALNPVAGLLAAAGVAVVLVVLDKLRRLRQP